MALGFRSVGRLSAVFLAVFAFVASAEEVRAQSTENRLPVSEQSARALPRENLVRLVFNGIADQVLAVKTDSFSGAELTGVTLLLKARPAVEDYTVLYGGICSLRILDVQLDGATEFDRVADVRADLVYALVGEPTLLKGSTVPTLKEPAPHGPITEAAPAATEVQPDSNEVKAAERACAAFDKPNRVIEAPSAADVYYAGRALMITPELFQSKRAVFICQDINERCPADLPAQLAATQLQKVERCYDQELMQIVRVSADHICVVLDLLISGGISQEEGWEMMVAGPWANDESFKPNRIFVRRTTTYID